MSDSKTWLTAVPEWVEYFGLALSVRHGTTTELLAQKGFEAVFRNTCEAVGRRGAGNEEISRPHPATRRSARTEAAAEVYGREECFPVDGAYFQAHQGRVGAGHAHRPRTSRPHPRTVPGLRRGRGCDAVRLLRGTGKANVARPGMRRCRSSETTTRYAHLESNSICVAAARAVSSTAADIP